MFLPDFKTSYQESLKNCFVFQKNSLVFVGIFDLYEISAYIHSSRRYKLGTNQNKIHIKNLFVTLKHRKVFWKIQMLFMLFSKNDFVFED